MEYLYKIKNQKPAGMTLLEILVALSIFILLFVVSGDFIINVFRSLRFGSEFDEAVINARRAIEDVAREVRGANNSDNGMYPIALAEGNDFIFYSDIDYDGDFDRVRYFIANRILYKVVTEPGPLRNYLGASATSTIAKFINNGEQDAFIFYDGAGNETADLDSIRLVRIHLRFNVTPGVSPNDILIETDVNLRNLKSNL